MTKTSRYFRREMTFLILTVTYIAKKVKTQRWQGVRNKKSKLAYREDKHFSQAAGSILTLFPPFLLYDGKGVKIMSRRGQ